MCWAEAKNQDGRDGVGLEVVVDGGMRPGEVGQLTQLHEERQSLNTAAPPVTPLAAHVMEIHPWRCDGCNCPVHLCV